VGNSFDAPEGHELAGAVSGSENSSGLVMPKSMSAPIRKRIEFDAGTFQALDLWGVTA
jgi:hypothetical protein